MDGETRTGRPSDAVTPAAKLRRAQRLTKKAKHLQVVGMDGKTRPAGPSGDPRTSEKKTPEYVDTATLLNELVKGMTVMVKALGALRSSVERLEEKIDALDEEVSFLSEVVLVPPQEQK